LTLRKVRFTLISLHFPRVVISSVQCSTRARPKLLGVQSCRTADLSESKRFAGEALPSSYSPFGRDSEVI
jgi:hypothetical protein